MAKRSLLSRCPSYIVFFINQRHKIIGLTLIAEVYYIRGEGSGLVTWKEVTIMCPRFIQLKIVQYNSS